MDSLFGDIFGDTYKTSSLHKIVLKSEIGEELISLILGKLKGSTYSRDILELSQALKIIVEITHVPEKKQKEKVDADS